MTAPYPKPEAIIQREVMLAASKGGYTIWRNNVATAWAGQVIAVRNSTMILPSGKRVRVEAGQLILDARPIKCGLTKGASDLIGMKEVVVTQEMVGTTVAVFAAIEVKSATGRVRKEQKTFLDHVRAKGGIATVARDVEDIE